jgi:hypothetical protein
MSDEHDDEEAEVAPGLDPGVGELLEQVSDGLDAVAMAIDKLTATVEARLNSLIASIDAH